MIRLINEISEKLKKHEQIVVAIDGPCASGKSSLASYLSTIFPTTIYHMDDFFLPEELKTEERLNQVGGNVYYERFEKDILSKIDNDSITYQKYSCRLNKLEGPIKSINRKLIIIEGAYSLHKKLREYYDYKVLLKIDRNIQLERLKDRSPSHIYQRFINEWIPLEDTYFNNEKLEDIVDLIVIPNIK